MNESYLKIGDEYLYYRYNEMRPDRKSILFVHGLGDSGLSFEDAFNDKRFNNYNLIVPDFIGYGRSSGAADKKRYSYDLHVKRLWKLIRKLKLDNLIVVGHSMGGDLTTLLCHSDKAGIIKKYVNIEGDITQFDQTISRAAVQANKGGRFDRWFELGLKKRIVFDGLGHLRSGRIYFASLSFCRPEALLENAIELVKRNTCLDGKFKSEIGKIYKELTIPRVFCYGTDSLSKESLEFLKQNNLETKAFEGIGHCPMTDCSDKFYSFLYKFIQTNKTSARRKNLDKPDKLEDLLRKNQKVVFCGTAAGTVSAQKKQYYAGPGNKFWKTLSEIGLTDKLLLPSEFENLPKFNIGLTDLEKMQSGMDNQIEFKKKSREELAERIEKFNPKILCFNGKRAAQEYLGHKVDYGLQIETIGITKLFVAPSTSGAANRFWDIKVWRKLAKFSCK